MKAALFAPICLVAGLNVALAQGPAADPSKAPPPAPPPIKFTADECSVWDREKAFAQTIEKKDRAAFEAMLHPSAVFSAATPGQLRGRAEILESWAPLLDGKDLVLRWHPEFVSIAAGQDIAVSRGPFTLENKAAKKEERFVVGEFVTVWVRDTPKGPWLALYDGLGAPPSPIADEKEFRAFFTGLPKTCPK